MEQQCVYFHTEKQFSIANTILETDGVEILFSAESIEIPLRNLSAGEKDAWYDYVVDEMVKSLPAGTYHKILRISDFIPARTEK